MPWWRRNVSTTCALALAHEPGVDEDARELGADGLVHERGGDRRVDAAGQPADGARVADLGADGVDCVSMIDAIVQVGRQPQTSYRKRLSSSWPPGVWTTSGWNWTPWIRRPACSNAATGASAVEPWPRSPRAPG